MRIPKLNKSLKHCMKFGLRPPFCMPKFNNFLIGTSVQEDRARKKATKKKPLRMAVFFCGCLFPSGEGWTEGRELKNERISTNIRCKRVYDPPLRTPKLNKSLKHCMKFGLRPPFCMPKLHNFLIETSVQEDRARKKAKKENPVSLAGFLFLPFSWLYPL